MGQLLSLSYDNEVSFEEKWKRAFFEKLFENPGSVFIYEFKKCTLKGHALRMKKWLSCLLFFVAVITSLCFVWHFDNISMKHHENYNVWGIKFH